MRTSRSTLSTYTPDADVPGSRVTSDQEVRVATAGFDGYADGAFAPAAARSSIRVAIVDDDRTLREGCASVLRVDGFNVTALGRGDEAIEMLQRTRFDIMLVDVCMSPVSGMDILKAVMNSSPSTLVVLMTGNPSLGLSIEAMRIGAWDYLPKPYSGTQLQLLLGRAAHVVATRQQQEEATSRLVSLPGGPGATQVVGSAPAFQQALDLARRVATTTASVMIVGETGTGKELIAQYIHRSSRRSAQTLVSVNCAAIPEQLLESEMFGHRKGSFTGADRDRMGLLEAADRGTLFLDELTEMSLGLQAKMLRVVQDGAVRRVGSEQVDTVVDVRFISATNRDPLEAIRDKKLREDLYYRLNVVEVAIPPLRERAEDIPSLANAFLRRFWTRHRAAKEAMPEFSQNSLEAMSARPWRGNVRELQNLVEYVSVVAQPASMIQPHHLPLEQQVENGAESGSALGLPLNAGYHASKEQVLAAFEKKYVTRLVARASGNMSRAARLASVDRTTLYRLLERHGFRRDLDETVVAAALDA